MVVRGRVQNGVVVLADGVCLPEGQLVTVLTPPLASSSQPEETAVAVSKERQEALQQLIGIWKTGAAPNNNEEVERILDQERMKKYG
jgi:hypothetical protein